MLRDEADQAAADAARIIAELTERLSPRNIVSPRRITARLGGNRTLTLAVTMLPVAALAIVAAAAAARRRRATP